MHVLHDVILSALLYLTPSVYIPESCSGIVENSDFPKIFKRTYRSLLIDRLVTDEFKIGSSDGWPKSNAFYGCFLNFPRFPEGTRRLAPGRLLRGAKRLRSSAAVASAQHRFLRRWPRESDTGGPRHRCRTRQCSTHCRLRQRSEFWQY